MQILHVMQQTKADHSYTKFRLLSSIPRNESHNNNFTEACMQRQFRASTETSLSMSKPTRLVEVIVTVIEWLVAILFRHQPENSFANDVNWVFIVVQ